MGGSVAEHIVSRQGSRSLTVCSTYPHASSHEAIASTANAPNQFLFYAEIRQIEGVLAYGLCWTQATYSLWGLQIHAIAMSVLKTAGRVEISVPED